MFSLICRIWTPKQWDEWKGELFGWGDQREGGGQKERVMRGDYEVHWRHVWKEYNETHWNCKKIVHYMHVWTYHKDTPCELDACFKKRPPVFQHYNTLWCSLKKLKPTCRLCVRSQIQWLLTSYHIYSLYPSCSLSELCESKSQTCWHFIPNWNYDPIKSLLVLFLKQESICLCY
jgi:hypothetical protein